MRHLAITNNLAISSNEITLSFSRSSGPGGQNVNKVNSKVLLEWDISHSKSVPKDVCQRFISKYRSRISSAGLCLISSNRFRSRDLNIEDCQNKLREMIIAVLLPPKIRKKSAPSRSARKKRLNNKKLQSERKKRRSQVKYDEY